MLRRQKDTDAARRKKTGRPIFRTIFNAMMLVTLVEVVLLAVSIAITNVDGRLNQNAKDMLNMQVRNRVSYVQDLMQDAQNLTDLSEHINNTVLAMQEEGQLDLAELNTSREKSDALLTAIAPELVNTLRAKPVSGIFVVLNTVNLHNLDVGCGLPGIYLRDLDPDARPSEDNADLMIECGSSAVVKKLGITTDKSWQPTLRYYGLKDNGFFKTPFQTAWEDGARLNAEDYGRWTTSAYKIGNDSRTAIAYSQPLILPDGTIYGVVGVELLTSYLQTKLPYSELQDGNTGTYFLVSTTADEKDTSFIVSKAVTSSEDMITSEAPAGMMNCELRADECWLTLRNKDYYAVALPITLYSRNAPFSNERWLLIGTVNSKVLFAFADNVRNVIAIAIVFTLVLGALGSLVIARNLAHPVELLYHEVVDGQEKKQFPQLSHTNIRELDRLADALTSLNSELLNNSTKFLRIMDMASVELGGYELRFDTGSVYVTDNFFALLGAPQPKDHFLSVRRFEEKLSNIQLSHPCTTTAEGDKMLTIRKEGETRYIMLRVTNDQTTQVGRPYVCKTGDRCVESTQSLGDELFSGRQFGKCLDAFGIQCFSVNKAGLDGELSFGVIGIFAQNLSSSNRIGCAGSQSGGTLQYRGNLLQIGSLESEAEHGVFDNRILNACSPQVTTKLGIICNSNALIVDDDAGGSILQLLSQIGDQLLFALQYFLIWQDVSPPEAPPKAGRKISN